MCGRFVRFSSVTKFADLFAASGHPAVKESYNIPPSSQVLVARNGTFGRELASMKWGLVPAWSDKPKTEYSTINARAETVADKPAFRSAFKHRRCLIAADGFYEWHVEQDGHKQPYFINLVGDEPFAFAGIWERWEKGDVVLDSCSIIVTEANELMHPIHERMPVILDPDDYDAWMEPDVEEAFKLQSLLKPFASAKMKFHPVSTAVNSPRNDSPNLIG
jgi:putative SOS response-associated peptidase YedK